MRFSSREELEAFLRQMGVGSANFYHNANRDPRGQYSSNNINDTINGNSYSFKKRNRLFSKHWSHIFSGNTEVKYCIEGVDYVMKKELEKDGTDNISGTSEQSSGQGNELPLQPSEHN